MAAAREPGDPGRGKITGLTAANYVALLSVIGQASKLNPFKELLKYNPFMLLGILDVENTPCARDSLLNGVLGSLVAGFGHFLLTSRIRRSCDVGVGGFILVTLGCWFHCRYNYAKQRIQQRIIREGMKNKILYESTHLDPERKPTNSNGSN